MTRNSNAAVKQLDTEFDRLVTDVLACNKCERMCESKRVLNRGCGPLSASILVIGEAPGRLGADASELPFHGDKSGHNFEDLLALVGLKREDLFITNAALCNPRDPAGNNSTPKESEIAACSAFLKAQIDLINPKIVVSLGATALRALAYIEPHGLTLKDSVRTAAKWYGRQLLPLYHPGQRAMIHRSFANQTADYQFLAERVRRLGGKRARTGGQARASAVNLASAVLTRFGKLSYFSFHKFSYLAEYLYVKRTGKRLSGAYFVRQKDGPYCVDLHPQKLKNAGAGIEVVGAGDRLYVLPPSLQLFNEQLRDDAPSSELTEIVDEVFQRYSKLSNAKLKTAVYLTGPMRTILRKERSGSNQFNAPIEFSLDRPLPLPTAG